MPLAHGALTPAPVAVSLLRDEGQPVRVQIHGSASLEPDLGWSGSTQPAPYRLVLIWSGAELALTRPLPEIPTGGFGPVQGMSLQRANGQVRLELQLNQSVQPTLRRSGDSWVLRLEVDTRISAPAAAKPAAPVPASRPAKPEILLVDLTVNGQRLPNVALVERWPDGALLLAENSWTEARLNPSGQQRTLSDGSVGYPLETVAGLTYRVDRGALGLEVNAPASAFVGSTLGPQGPVVVPPRRPDPGVMLNYDLSMAHSTGSGIPSTSGATLEAVAFNGFGNIVTSGVLTDDGTQRSFRRLDTYWRYDMPERMETLVIGDTVGTGGAWSRPVRYAGLRWGRDFGMRPGFVTMPQLSLAGQAALPSTVDVLVNNARRISQPVAPGPFDLTNVPVVTGAGEVNLVVRDMLGRETIVKQSYYASPRLLAPGLVDFSVEAGWLRTGYGQDSSYGDAFASGTLRRGLTQALTGEARLELQPARRAAGLELAGLLGTWGLARGALALSSDSLQGSHEQGTLLQLGVERSTPTSGGAVQYEYATRGFAPLGEAIGAQTVGHRSRSQWLASIGGPVWGPVNGALNLVRRTRWDGERITSLGAFLSAPVGQRASIGLSLNRRLDGDHAWSAGVNLTMPLDDGVFTAARVDRNTDGRLVGNASAVSNPPAGPGLGWRVEASTQESQRARGGVQYNTNHAVLALDAATDAHGNVAVRAGARGTVGVLGGVAFASRPVGESGMALVEVEGLAGVPIKRSNQVVATTDARGFALVPGLLPWQKNLLEIDAEELPMDADLGDTTQQVVPYPRSGSVVKFKVRRTRQALVVLHRPGGLPVPEGALVRLDDGPEFVVGRRGEVWLTDLAAEHQGMQVRWKDGACKLAIDVPPMADGLPGKIGPVACGGGQP